MGQTATSRDVALMSAFLLIATKKASRPICIEGPILLKNSPVETVKAH
jgi:hypothetical protein